MPKNNKRDPYITSGELKLVLDNPSDPYNTAKDFSWAEINPGERMDLKGDLEWSQLETQATVSLDSTELAALLPPNADFRNETRCLLSVRCAATNFRTPFELKADADEDGKWSGMVTFDRRDVRSRVTMVPMLVRRSTLPDYAGANVATHRFALLAFSHQNLQCHIDYIDRQATTPVQLKFCAFNDTQDDFLKKHYTAMYHIAATEDPPTVYINTQAPFTQIQSILKGPEVKGSAAALRYLLEGMLAQRIWSELFYVALDAAADEGGGHPEFPDDWRGNLLKKFLPSMFPEDNDVNISLEKALTKLEERQGILNLQARLSAVSQENASIGQQFKEAERSVRSHG